MTRLETTLWALCVIPLRRMGFTIYSCTTLCALFWPRSVQEVQPNLHVVLARIQVMFKQPKIISLIHIIKNIDSFRDKKLKVLLAYTHHKFTFNLQAQVHSLINTRSH
jgi:hypothetical protein